MPNRKVLPVEVILGGGTIGEGTYVPDKAHFLPILQTASSHNPKHLIIDTARSYPPGNTGKSELLINETLSDPSLSGFDWVIDTKVISRPAGAHKKENIARSLKESLEALGNRPIRTLLLHSPDRSVPISEVHSAIDEEYRKGTFKEFGLSSYEAEEVDAFVELANSKGYIRPTVYQGNYNPLGRHSDEKLFPTLRKHGIRFVAYSPTAGGFLLGKHTRPDQWETLPKESRYGGTGIVNQIYREAFFKPEMFDAVGRFHSILASLPSASSYPSRVTHANEICLRWLAFHSELASTEWNVDKNELNGVIVSAHSTEQFEMNVAPFEKGPLEGDEGKKILQAIDELWESVKHVAD